MDIASVSNPGQVLPAVPETQNPTWLVENRQLIRNVKAVNASELFGENSELTFAMDPDTKRLLVRIVDRRTHKVVAQLPPDYVLQLARELGQQSSQTLIG